ncbi:MAG: lysylphosphatidylglycerol synthase transmembrane domain-containing protein [Bryobacteraceae bacterium]
MSDIAETPNNRSKAWIGYLVAAACLVWVFHDVRWRDLFSQMKTVIWWLLVPAVAADIGSYVTQGARWSLLLRPLAPLSVIKATQAIYAALFTNEVLPLRLGEVLRGYLASRWTSLSLTRVFSSIFVERFLDAFWMVLAFGAVVLGVPLPRYLVDAEEMLAGGVFGAAAIFIYLVIRKERQIEAENKPSRSGANVRPGFGARLSHLIENVATTLRSIGSARSFYGAAALSSLLLALQVVSFWLVMRAYGMPLSIWHGAAVFLIVHLGTMVPNAPSNVGTYQFFTVLGLMLFDVDKTVAAGFSVAVFLILTIPLWVIGLFALGQTGLTLRMVREEVAKIAKQR